MTENETRPEKRSALTELEFDERTRKRACWEAFAFEIIAENQIRVVNESYGNAADEHAYTVTVDRRPDGTIVPMHCNCPAAMHHDGACKHQVAAAVRRVVLGAACAYRADPSTDSEKPVVLADGGRAVTENVEIDEKKRCDEDWCPGPRENSDDPLPCFECFQAEA